MEQIQDTDLVKSDLLRQQDMEAERAPLEGLYRDLEQFFDPGAAGGFGGAVQTGGLENYNFDATGMQSLGRFSSAFGAITTPKNERWHGATVVDDDLADMPEVKRWCEAATDRLFKMRYAAHAGAGAAYGQDRRQLGCYGTGPLWIDEWKGRGMFYKTLHLSEVFIDQDFRGAVDTVHRKFELTARQAREQFGEENLPPKIRKALEQEKTCGEKFQFLHIVRPNERYEVERLDWRGKPIASRYVAIDEKWMVRKGGYFTMPIAVSRNTVSPGRKYGNSPGMVVIGTQRGLNQIAKTILRAGHKAVDPALAFYDDGDISKLVTKPGGLNPGLVDSEGRLLVQPIPQGGNLMIGREIQESEREVVRDEFLGLFFKLLTDESVQRSAAAVLEIAAEKGMLAQDFAEHYETEKLGVGFERELDIGMRAGQIPPMPQVMLEAGARPMVVMTNPLARLARAGEAAGWTRAVEVAVQAASAGRPDALDRFNFDVAIPAVAEVLGVRASWMLTDDELAELRRKREQDKQSSQMAEVVPDAAGAALDLAKANQIAAQGGMGMAA
jgi:hypothetical protein